MIFKNLQAAGWEQVGKTKEKGFFDFDLFSWMAWTWQTAAFFIFIASVSYTHLTLPTIYSV